MISFTDADIRRYFKILLQRALIVLDSTFPIKKERSSCANEGEIELEKEKRHCLLSHL